MLNNFKSNNLVDTEHHAALMQRYDGKDGVGVRTAWTLLWGNLLIAEWLKVKN